MIEPRSSRQKKQSLQPTHKMILVIVVVAILLFLINMIWKKVSTDKLAQEADSANGGHLVVLKSEEDYLEQMIPHHQEAVDTSKYIADNSQNEDLKLFAKNVVDNQTREIWTMIGLYQQWYSKQYGGNSAYMKMMPDLTTLSGTERDRAYIVGMIDHHNAAISMSKAVLSQTDKDNVEGFAQKVIDDQTKEVEILKGYLDKLPK